MACALPVMQDGREQRVARYNVTAVRAAAIFPDPPLRLNGEFLAFDSASAPVGAIPSFLVRRQFPRECGRMLVVDDDQGTLELRLIVLVFAMALRQGRVLVGVCREPQHTHIPCLYEPWSSCLPPSDWARAPSWDSKQVNGTLSMHSDATVVQLSLRGFARSTYYWGQSLRQARYGEWRELVPFLFTPRPWLRRVARCAAKFCATPMGTFTVHLSVRKLEPKREVISLLEDIFASFLPIPSLSVQSADNSLLHIVDTWADARQQRVFTCDLSNLSSAIQGEYPDSPVTRAVRMVIRSLVQVDISDDLQCRATDDCARMVADLMPHGGQLSGRVNGKAALVLALPCGAHGSACSPWRNDSYDPWSWHHPKEQDCKRAVAGRDQALLHINQMMAQGSRKTERSMRPPEEFPHIFHHVWFTWKTTTMPQHYVAYRESCLRLHPNYTFYLWSDDDNRDFLQKHYPWFVPFYDAYDQPVKMSDSVRFFLLHYYGGIYADLDVLCLKPMDSLLALERDRGSALLGQLGDSAKDARYSQNLPNALMISKRRSLYMLQCIRELVLRFSCTRFFEPMRDTGAEILHTVLHSSDLAASDQARALGAKIFFPIDWRGASWKNVSRRDRQKMHTDWLKPSFLLEAGLITEQSYTATFWTHGWKSWDR